MEVLEEVAKETMEEEEVDMINSVVKLFQGEIAFIMSAKTSLAPNRRLNLECFLIDVFINKAGIDKKHYSFKEVLTVSIVGKYLFFHSTTVS